MLGCATEFIKNEGFTFSLRRRQIYTTMSYWTSGSMLPSVSASGSLNTADIGGSQQISVAAQPCGCVYYADVDESFSAINFNTLVCGEAQAEDANGNTCSVGSSGGIAAPDNIAGVIPAVLLARHLARFTSPRPCCATMTLSRGGGTSTAAANNKKLTSTPRLSS